MPKAELARPEDDVIKKRKRRNIGTFPCSECSKVFTRSDHLARHYLNHQPKEVYVCNHIIRNHNGERRACGKTFVRKDLRERHMKRHSMLQDTLGTEDPDNIKPPVPGNELAPVDGTGLPSIGRGSVGSAHSLQNPQQPAHNAQLQSHQNTSPGSHLLGAPQLGEVASGLLRGAPATLQGPLTDSGVLTSPPGPQQLSPTFQPIPSAMAHQAPANQHHGFQQHQGPQYTAPYNGQLAQGLAYASETAPVGLPPMGASMGASNQISPAMAQGMGQAMLPQSTHQMGPPPNAKADLQMALRYTQNSTDINRNNGWPQSQNDILSWLFMDTPDMPRIGGKSGVPSQTLSQSMSPGARYSTYQQFSPQTQRLVANDRGVYEDDMGLLTPFYHNPPELNVGLQDLNFFLSNDNPLDEVFFKSQADQHAHGVREKSVAPGIGIYLSTASSSSPSNTNESITPKTADLSPQSSEMEPIEKRLEAHARANVAANKQFYMSSEILDGLFQALPNLSRQRLDVIFKTDQAQFSLEDRLSFYLYGYWEAFHTRFSIIHKPSFDTASCEPLLLLSMLLIGCMYCADSIEDSENHRMCPEYKFSLLVAVPLRFTLFQHDDFKSPVKVWILQSLNLLEWCEKNYLLRAMHERAHIHHGTTVQLLRRSPFLGGNPTIANKAVNSASDTGTSGGEEEQSDTGTSDIDETSSKDYMLFRKWVDSESMKRVTFMTFYLDVIDYIKFRHNPQIPFFQLQLLHLPCDEEALWNSEEVDGSFRKIVKRQKKLQRTSGPGMRKLKEQYRIRPGMNFLSALKKLMKSQRLSNNNYKLPMFTKSILFGGLVSIMHQMQQAELQNNFTLLMASDRMEKNKNQVWKEILTKVFDTWETEMHSQQDNLTHDPFFGIQKGQCKFPMYHLAQIIGISDINHYDIAIFGGSPGNMSVDATSKDMSIVQRKLTSIWSRSHKTNTVNDLVNFKSVVHCYWLLWSLMLAPLEEDGKPTNGPITYGWRVDHDYYDAMYAVSIATLVLWCYTFTSTGIESTKFSDKEAIMSLEETRDYDKIREFAQEDAYQFLFRMRQEFTNLIRQEGLPDDFILHKVGPRSTQVPLYKVIAKYCELLPEVASKQNIAGLCFLVGTNLLKSQWQVIRENAKLIINCGLRSVGKKSVHCTDLFDNAFTD